MPVTVHTHVPHGQGFPPDPIPRIILGGSVNLFAGAPGSGKTALLAGLLRKLRDGEPIFGHLPNPVPKIAVLSIDRSWAQSSKLWFDLAGFPEIPYYCLQDDLSFDPAQLEHKRLRMKILRDCIEKLLPLPFGSFLSIDPIAPFLGGNLNDYDTCMVACTRLRRLAREYGITILGSSHAGKQKGDKKDQYRRLQDRIVGSTAQFGYTDTQLYLASPEETGEKHHTFCWTPHHAPAEVFKLGRAEDGTFVSWEASVQAEEETRVLAAITGDAEGTGWNELLISTEVSKTTLHRLLMDEIRDGRVVKVGHGRYRRILH